MSVFFGTKHAPKMSGHSYERLFYNKFVTVVMRSQQYHALNIQTQPFIDSGYLLLTHITAEALIGKGRQ